jgi:hypothetical protein
MHEGHYRHLPVVDDGRVIGIVSVRDALGPSSKRSSTKCCGRKADPGSAGLIARIGLSGARRESSPRRIFPSGVLPADARLASSVIIDPKRSASR